MNHLDSKSEENDAQLPVGSKYVQEFKQNSILMEFDVKFIEPINLDSESKLILMVLLSMRNLKVLFVSNKQLSQLTSLSLSTLKRRLSELVDKELISRNKKNYGRTRVTQVNEKGVALLILKSSFAPITVKTRLSEGFFK